MVFRRRFWLVVFFVVLPTDSRTYGWGGEGHETVCEIAFLELKPAAQATVSGIMANDSDPEFRTFRQGCTWPDTSGEVQLERRPDHYINLPRYWQSIWYEECPTAERCLFSAIRRDQSILASPTASAAARLTALKFLGHWIGDLHQPLHVSFKDDRGGGKIALEESIGCTRKLHAVWDTCIPRDLMEELGAQNTKRLAELLQGQITPQERKEWSATDSLVVWANESFSIARLPAVRYCSQSQTGKVCEYEPGNQEFDEETDEIKSLPLTSEYEDEHGKVVTQRLKQAGVRLGAMLNRIFNE